MIHVFVTAHESVRFPGKNGRLWDYTAAWLAAEAAGSAEPVRVWFGGDVPEGVRVPGWWGVLRMRADDHHVLQGRMERAVLRRCGAEGEPVFVLAQLTQPLRRRGLLGDVAASCRTFGAAATYCPGRDHGWRRVSAEGWDAPDEGRGLFFDGALFAWCRGHLGDSWRPGVPWTRRGLVCNYAGPVVDVDAPGDLPGWLDAAWAGLMLGRQAI